jgi:hypothetical protein
MVKPKDPAIIKKLAQDIIESAMTIAGWECIEGCEKDSTLYFKAPWHQPGDPHYKVKVEDLHD